MPAVIVVLVIAALYTLIKALWPVLLLIAGVAGLALVAKWALEDFGPGSKERLRVEREEKLRLQREIEAKQKAGDQALNAISRLDAARKAKSSEPKALWDKAQTQLEGRYSWANVMESSTLAVKRLEYLQVVEPEPALEDFLPKKLPAVLSREFAQKFLSEAQSDLKYERAAHREREEDRQKEIEEVNKLIETLLAEEKLERLQLQEELWPADVELDPNIRAIDGIDRQVDAQNTKLEEQFRQLTGLLRAGLENLPKKSSDSVRGSQAIRSDPVYGADKRIENALKRMPLPVMYYPKVDVGYLEASQQALVEFQFPDVKLIPTSKGYKYTRNVNRITELQRPASEIKSAYAELISQLSLLTIAFAFAADYDKQVDTLVFNGYVDTIDPRSGHSIQPCLVSVRVTRAQFEKINLRKVEAQACLKHLSASVSRSPSELAPVRPILDFEMFDPRFVAATDAISTLDTRPNLMDLTPTEFEGLIQNLFEKMGLEARQTQASRDGGVDCIAYDNRPIFGGKVVIQAKRYKNTVGVSAVRDLYGTLQNEGASKGILVTTSGYGAASFEFAQNKPIELLEGSHLLYLLKEHAGIDARIEAPEGWRDPVADSGEDYQENY